MKPIELARRLAELGQVDDAQKGYELALNEKEITPEEELEAAAFLVASQAEDYKKPYRTFVSLFNRDCFQAEILDILAQTFYFPNVKDLQRRYEANCKRLEKYPYAFRQDFPAFEDLPIWFFPFDDQGYLPFYPAENRFGAYVDFNDPVIDRYFFKDLDNPILAKDVFSQYQLEYLNDTVRKSEWVGRENHIYLHYSDWTVFCAYLQCLEFKKLLKDEKFVFLIEDEMSRYPIDFKEEYGVDYSKYPVRPLGIREVNRLVWHTQLATHNGGDFFNEIFAGHPNLLTLDSVMFDEIKEYVLQGKKDWKDIAYCTTEAGNELLKIKNPTLKDFFVAFYLQNTQELNVLDRNSRIAPALFFQPHFSNMVYALEGSEKAEAYTLTSEMYDDIRNSPLFQGFKYIKTFTPLRRITTSYAASARFSSSYVDPRDPDTPTCIGDMLSIRLLNRSYMVDPGDRLYRDSILVRFEDGKLNPTATFVALAEFLDIPYTESMKGCTEFASDWRIGFSTRPVYATYDEFAGDAERAILEYFMREVYETYGYDFQYYHGEPVDEAWLEQKLSDEVALDKFVRRDLLKAIPQAMEQQHPEEPPLTEEQLQDAIDQWIAEYQRNRVRITKELLMCSRFANKNGEPLQMMPQLKLDPALLEQPLYH